MAVEKVKLGKPYKALGSDGEFMSEVSMRTKVLVGDWRAANKAAKDVEERVFHLLLRLCNLDISEMDQLEMADYEKLADKIDMGDSDPKAR